MKDLGRRVKKYIGQNRYTMREISRILDSSIEECMMAYESYTGKKILASFLIVGNKRQRENLEQLILQNQKILLYGDNGVGKSSLPKLIADKIGWKIKTSYPRNTEDLLKDFAQLPLQTRNTIFVIEGDLFYWRSYALINHYIRESKNPIIIIVNKKETVHGSVTKQLVPLKLQNPTKADVKEFIEQKYPDFKGDINDVYDSDMRICIRKILYGIETYKPKEMEKLDAQQVAYKIINKKAKREDIEKCIHPYLFVLNWLGNNAHRFYEEYDFIDDVSFVDSNKYNLKKKYLDGILLNLPKKQNRGKLIFPPIKYKEKKEKEEDWSSGKKKGKKTKTPTKVKTTEKKETTKQQTLLKFSGDMVL
jgi:hypothetical protein